MSSITQGDGFTEVTHGLKKRKASNSPTLPSQSKPGLSESPLGTSVHSKPSIKNTIPVILSGVNEKFKNWRKLIGELRQFHPSLKISQIKESPKGNFLVICNSVQDIIILQNASTIKAALGKNVKVSLPKAFQTNKVQTKSLAMKGVPTDIMDSEFTEFLDLNKINYAKAERLESKKDGRVLSIFQPGVDDPAEDEVLLFQNLVCQVTGIVYKVEECRQPVSVMQCFYCQSFGHLAKNCRSKQECLICSESHSHKGCPNKEARKPKSANCKGHMLHHTKGVWNTKSRHSGSMWLITKNLTPQ